MHKLTQLKNKLIIAAEDKRQTAQILEISELFESIIADYEMEIEQAEYVMAQQVKSERWVIALLETYGVDIQKALGRSDNQIKRDYDLAVSCNVYRVPEKLKQKLL